MRRQITTLLVLAALACQGAEPLFTLETDEIAGLIGVEKWRTVEDLSVEKGSKGWSAFTEGEGILVNGLDGKAGDARTEEAFGDVEVELEFMLSPDSNSGLYFMDRYEVQIKDSFGKQEVDTHDCGAIYQRRDRARTPPHFEGHVPLENACRRPGEWQTLKVLFRAPRFDADGKKTENARFEEVVLNGVTVQVDAEVSGATQGGIEEAEVGEAPLRIQGNHGAVAFRKLEIRPLAD